MRYRYSGPLSGFTLADGREIILSPGGEVDLDPDAPPAITLVARNHLTAMESAPAAPTQEEAE